jgi:hypothetical protein
MGWSGNITLGGEYNFEWWASIWSGDTGGSGLDMVWEDDGFWFF